tara:strand:- start:2877 stop:5222 length:2346 start_codon:yes stop_codon:yes gene_type:complete
MASLTGSSIASSYNQLLSLPSGGLNSTTLVSITDGDTSTAVGFQVSTNALSMTGTNQLQFGDTGTYIYQSADGVLDLVSDTTIEINATTIDMNGALDLSGNGTIGGTLTVNGDLADIAGAHPTLKLTDIAPDDNYGTIGYSDGVLSFTTNGGDDSGASDTMVFYNHGSTQRMKIKSNGNVQIGAHASGTPLASNLFLVGTGATTEGIVIGRAGDSQNALDQYAQVNMYGGTTNLISRGGTSSEGTIALVTTSDGSTYNTRLFVNSNGNIDYNSTGGSATTHSIKTYSDTTGHTSVLNFDKSHNDTVGTLTATTDGSYLGMIQFRGIDSGGNIDNGAYIAGVQDGSASSRVPSKLIFSCYDGSNEQIPFIIDANSKTSLSNNDSGGTGGSDSTTGNTLFGMYSGLNIASGGVDNSFYGHASGAGNTTGDFNTAIGNISGFRNQTGVNNTYVGYGSGMGASGNSHSDNTALGFKSLNAITTGEDNVAVGSEALKAETIGDKSTAIGYQALLVQNTVDGEVSNTAVGYSAGKAITTGIKNVIIGSNAAIVAQDVDETVIIGQAACGDGNLTATGTVAIGRLAGYALVGGAGNTLIGYKSGDILTTGDNNTIIGFEADPSANSGTGQIAIGKGVTCAGDNIATLGIGSNTASLGLDGSDTSWAAASSDERLKENIKTSSAGLDVINDLRPVTYNWKKSKDVSKDMPQYKDSNEPVLGNKYGEILHGFIAQEVKEVIDNHNSLKEGFKMWKLKDDGTQTVADGNLIPILVKAVQELSAKVTELENK